MLSGSYASYNPPPARIETSVLESHNPQSARTPVAWNSNESLIELIIMIMIILLLSLLLSIMVNNNDNDDNINNNKRKKNKIIIILILMLILIINKILIK